jgi:hypothetical protein
MYPFDMRTTVTLEADVAAAVENVRREKGVGLSEAVNTLIRSGLGVSPSRHWEPPIPMRIGLQIDVRNVAEAIEQLDGPNSV